MKRKRKDGEKNDLHVDESCLQDGTLGIRSGSEFPICHPPPSPALSFIHCFSSSSLSPLLLLHHYPC